MTKTENLKAILLDVDDTLFHLEGGYAEGLVEYLQLLQSKNIKVSLLTARNKYFVNKIVKKLKLKDPLILENGAQLYDPKTEESEVLSNFDKILLETIYESIKKFENIRIGINTTKGFYVNEKYYNELEAYLGKEDLYRIDDKVMLESVLSIWLRDLKRGMVDELINCLKEYHIIRKIEESDNLYSFFILDENAKKELGFTKWCTYCNILPDEVLFIGDSNSDLEVSKIVRISAAVGNSTSELKNVVDIIAKSNYGEGVLEILKQIFKF